MSKLIFDNKFKMYKFQTERRSPASYASIRILFHKKYININTASHLIFDLTYTHKNSNKYKNALIELNKLVKQYKDDKLKPKTEHTIEITKENRRISTINGYVNKYDFWIHKNEIHDMMKTQPNTIIIHKAEFYIDGIKQTEIDINNYAGDVVYRNLIENEVKFNFIDTSLNLDQIGEKVDWYVTIGGSGGVWIINGFMNYCEDRDINYKVKIITKAYTKINDPKQLSYLQKYAFNNNGTCVYDGLIDFFTKYNDSKNKHGKAIYNKLINNPKKYAKSYTIEEMGKLAKEINCSFTIEDLINNKDININKITGNRFNITFINTRFNHLDLLKCVSNINEISTEKYNEIKKSVSFYVEKMGNLLTLNGNYKIKTQYTDLINEWKNKYNINSRSIEINSDINKFINKYDDKVHRFFDNDMVIDDNLYNELDLKKAYFNYTKSSQYIGLPSGAYISCSGQGMTDKIFIEQFNNKIVGFYEVIPSNNRLDYLGFYCGKSYILFSATIKLLLDNRMTFKYINYVISPTIDCPFSDNFNMLIDGDNLVTAETTDKNPKDLVKAYCKIVGCMMIENDNFSIDVKPDREDKEFYKTMTRKHDIYKVDGLYKIIKTKDNSKSLKHMALSIHAYSSTIILEQILKMNKDDVLGVKVDSIVFRKGSKFNYDSELFKQPTKANIEGMLIGKYTDYREDEYYDEINKYEKLIHTEYFKPYFISKKNDIMFSSSFCGEHITKTTIFLGGAGGCGKTHSILSSKNFMMRDLLFTSTCWELIQSKVKENCNITGISLPKLTGEMNNQKVEKFNSNKYKYIVNDELTLQNNKTIKSIIDDNQGKFIILMGDIEYDGFYYQCSIGSNVCNPSKINCQYIKYTKNYRFNEPFNNKINDLRHFMNNNRGDKDLLYNYVKKEFSMCFRKKINEIQFNDDDIGISALKPIKNDKCLFSDHFYKQGANPQYYVKNTIFKNGLYRGAKLIKQPEGKNYTNSLFRTIHAYQGRELTQNNKIIILLNSLFDFNLLYTAISRARRLDQIIIFDMLKK